MLDTHPLYATHEHIQAGLLQTNEFRALAGYFENLPCWAPIVEKHRALMELDVANLSTSVTVLQAGRAILTLVNGTKHHIPDMETLEKHGYDKLPRRNANHPQFDALPQGEDVK